MNATVLNLQSKPSSRVTEDSLPVRRTVSVKFAVA